MEWLAALIRVIGVASPFTAPLVQLNSELEARRTNQRLDRLEDPISLLHPGVRKLSTEIYRELKVRNSPTLEFNDEFYDRFGRPLAALASYGAIKKTNVLGRRHPISITVVSPSYILYMAAFSGSERSMSKLVNSVDAVRPGQHIDGAKLSSELGIPTPVVRAVLELYVAKGYGLVTDELLYSANV